MALAVSLMPGPKHMVAGLGFDLLGDSSCLVVRSWWGLVRNLDWMYLLVAVIVNVSHIFVSELVFCWFCVHLHVRIY